MTRRISLAARLLGSLMGLSLPSGFSIAPESRNSCLPAHLGGRLRDGRWPHLFHLVLVHLSYSSL